MSDISFHESRAGRATIWLILGGVGFLWMVYQASKMPESSMDADRYMILSNILAYVFLMSSFGNKILAMIKTLNVWLLLASIASPFGSILLYIMSSHCHHDVPQKATTSPILAIFFGILIFVWLVGWWIADIKDFIKYGLKTFK